MPISVRIYNNGDTIINVVHPDHIADHIEYNCDFRWGCALVVDGEIKNKGYLDESRIMEIYNSAKLPDPTKFTPIPYR